MADPFSGVGISSIQGIKDAAAKSGMVPPLQDTSDFRVGGPYHGTSNAVDWSNGDDAGTPEMDRFAAWVAANYGANSLEIIHVNQDGSTVEWKNGVQQPTGFYGQDTLSQHRNHVHWAITNAGLTAAGSPSVNADNPGSSDGTVQAQTVGFMSDWVKPVIEFFVSAGMVAGGLGLILFGLTLVFKVNPASLTPTGAIVSRFAS